MTVFCHAAALDWALAPVPMVLKIRPFKVKFQCVELLFLQFITGVNLPPPCMP
jgi:hypothetical protein